MVFEVISDIDIYISIFNMDFWSDTQTYQFSYLISPNFNPLLAGGGGSWTNCRMGFAKPFFLKFDKNAVANLSQFHLQNIQIYQSEILKHKNDPNIRI